MTKSCKEKNQKILDAIEKKIYFLDNDNKLYSKYYNKSLKLNKSKEGYLYFNMYINKKRDTILFHRFMWIFYNKKIPKESNVIDHIDRNPLNNDISNLREVSIQENTINSKVNKFDLNIIKKMEEDHNKGMEPLEISKKYNIDSSHYRSIRKMNFKDKSTFKTGPKGLGKENVIIIKKRLLKGDDIYSIAKDFNCNPRSISKIKYGERWANLKILN